MTTIDRGSGVPIVLIPGIQGRWEWHAAGVDALSAIGRVITFSLADEPTSHATFDEHTGIDSYIQQVENAMDASGVSRAIICGISYGGLIAALFAARRPSRVAGVVLASAIPPAWTPNARTLFLLRSPRLLAPLFCLGSLRLLREMVAAKGGWIPGATFGVQHLWTVSRHPFSPTRMARRVRLLDRLKTEPEVSTVKAPALIVTGEPELDLVVPVSTTLEYKRLWPQAGTATLARTGHLGLISRPREFAALIASFASQISTDESHRRRVV